jgi:hypothetical protein
MINRSRTAFVSVATVAMIVLGSNAQAKSAASEPQSYLKFLRQLPSAAKGLSLLERFSSLDRTLTILKHDPAPGPRQLKRIATLFNQETSVFSKIQNNINALLASEAKLQGKYMALELQKESLLAAGRVNRARQVAMQQGQVFNVENSVQSLIATERGVATPTR